MEPQIYPTANFFENLKTSILAFIYYTWGLLALPKIVQKSITKPLEKNRPETKTSNFEFGT